MDAHITFAKIVATPTQNAWSQTYNAGKLFAVLALNNPEEPSKDDFLSLIGKEVFNKLEEEFFTLEKKDFSSIKESIAIACKKIPKEVNYTIIVTCIHKDAIYGFVRGEGNIFLKRNDDNIVLLNNTSEITGVSGMLNSNDAIILATNEFKNIIVKEELILVIANLSPNDIAEILAPRIHKNSNGQASALIIRCKIDEEIEESIEEDQEDMVEKKLIPIDQPFEHLDTYELHTAPVSIGNIGHFFLKILPHVNRLFSIFPKSLSHKKKSYISIAVILSITFLFSVFSAIEKRDAEKKQTHFEEIYNPAFKKYDDGQGLMDININLARETFILAKKILEKKDTDFPKNSKEAKNILILLEKIDKSMTSAQGLTSISPKHIEKTESGILEEQKKNPDGYITQDDKFIYIATEDNITSIDRGNSKSKKLVENNNTWQKIGGFGIYFGNLYLINKLEKEVIKFSAIASGFGKSKYLSSTSIIDFSKATSLTIDGSVYILFNDGEIYKFTKGKQDSFIIAGLDMPFIDPEQITTDASSQRVYILDSRHSRIVALNKQGEYQSQWQAKQLSSAKAIEVIDKESKINFLNSDGLWQFSIIK